MSGVIKVPQKEQRQQQQSYNKDNSISSSKDNISHSNDSKITNVVGFDPQYVLEKTFSKNLICPFCAKFMRNPIQTQRGEIACSFCYAFNKGDKNICPIDGISTEGEVFPDRAKEREILLLRTKCLFESIGCKWTGIIKDLEDHLTLCKFAPSLCNYCNASVTSIDSHYLECEVLLSQLLCPFKAFGCNYEPNTESELNNHIANTAMVHNTILSDHIKKSKIEQQKTDERLREKTCELQREIVLNQQQLGLYIQKVNSLEAKMNLLEFEVICKLETAECMGGKEDIVERVDKYEQELDHMNKTVSKMSSNLSDVDLRHQLHENTTYDGKMVWKIDNLSTRKQQAVSSKTTALHSAPAFASKYGYKFCTRLYLDGDGQGKGTHISLFFVLMKSEFDNLLEWPFSKRVTFTLINQDDQTKSVRETFTPDPKSSSFQKPVKQMNVASGCPCFVSHKNLQKNGFVKEDSFFLEILIH